jgi:O-acetyl-ADP-ribose deacetylase (regulator of RNase III)
MLEKKINETEIRLEQGDLTAMEIESIVHYASPDLNLGSGFGSAIAARGGASIQEELKPFGTIEIGEAVVTSAGELNSNFIVHAVGPRFQEDETEQKLEKTMENALKAAKEKGIAKIAFPPMGTGFYGIPLKTCAIIMLQAIKNYLAQDTSIKEIVICVLDNREYRIFQEEWGSLN